MFKFLKRLRGKKEEPQLQPDAEATEVIPEPVVETPVAPPEPATEVPASVTAIDPEPEKGIEPEPVFKTPIEAVVEPTEEPEQITDPEPKAEVVEVELPKRSLSDGIRSLFSSNVDIEDLEDILLLADFGVEASVEITESLRKAASKTGATSDAELRLLLKELLVEKLHRDDLQLNL